MNSLMETSDITLQKIMNGKNIYEYHFVQIDLFLTMFSLTLQNTNILIYFY